MTAFAAPIDYDALRVALVATVRGATGLDSNHVVAMEPEHPNWPRPQLPYVAFKITTPSMRYGTDWQDQASTVGPRGVLVSLQSFAATHEQAYGLMAATQAGMMTPGLTRPLELAGFAVARTGNVVDLSMLLTSAYEGRAQMDLTLSAASNLAVPFDTIAIVPVAGAVDTDATSVAIEFQQEQP